MKLFPKIGLVLLILYFSICQYPISARAAEDRKVQSVEVQLIVGGRVYEGLQERIEFSITRVGEKLLLSQPLSLLQKNKDTVKTAIFNVFSKVLTGFKLESVELALGEHTKVIVQMTPVAPLISSVGLKLDIKDLSPQLEGFTNELRIKIETELNRILGGLPVDSIGWSEESIFLVVNYLVERDFPGYTIHCSMKPGSETELDLLLTPNDNTIDSVRVVYISDSFPVWLIRAKTRSYNERLSVLKGLPIEFANHYQSSLEKYLEHQLNGFPELDRLGLSTKLRLEPDTNATCKIMAVSKVVQTKLEGRYFVDNDNSFGYVQGYLGYRTDDAEWFVRKYWGSYPGGDTKLGVSFPMGPNFTGALEYELNHCYKDLWFHFRFERGDYLDLTLGLDHSPNEALVGIVLNNRANLEFVKFDQQFGVQVMLHF